MGNLGLTEMLLIGILLLIFFGPPKLPELGKAFGKGREDRVLRDHRVLHAARGEEPMTINVLRVVEAILPANVDLRVREELLEKKYDLSLTSRDQ